MGVTVNCRPVSLTSDVSTSLYPLGAPASQITYNVLWILHPNTPLMGSPRGPFWGTGCLFTWSFKGRFWGETEGKSESLQNISPLCSCEQGKLLSLYLSWPAFCRLEQWILNLFSLEESFWVFSYLWRPLMEKQWLVMRLSVKSFPWQSCREERTPTQQKLLPAQQHSGHFPASVATVCLSISVTNSGAAASSPYSWHSFIALSVPRSWHITITHRI